MKQLFFLFIVCCATPLFGQQWEEDFSQAQEKAFNLVLYRADFPKRKKNQLVPELKSKHESLAAQYNPQGYFPWVVVFGKDKSVKGNFVYMKEPVSQYIKQIKSF